MDSLLSALMPIILIGIGYAWLQRHSPAMLPGPKGYPIIGNLLDMPKEYEWLQWAKYKNVYGAISSVNVLGQRLVFLNSLDVCKDLMEKKSLVYAERPLSIFAGQIIGWDQHMIMSQYSDRFRIMRRMLFNSFGTKVAVKTFQPAMDFETNKFLSVIGKSSEDLLDKIKLNTASILLKVSYGYTIATEGKDPLVNLLEHAASEFYIATKPGKWPVDIIPQLRYIPDWIPGIPFKAVAKEFRKTLADIREVPALFVQEQMRNEIASPSYLQQMLQKDLDDNKKQLAKISASDMYGGGTDTISATIYAFFLALCLHPFIQVKVQKEMESVIGRGRLPALEDRDKLPYFDAVHKEVMRWHVVGPLGIPHCTSEDDIYKGYFIPKGSLIFANLWQIAHDEDLYSDPYAFNPGRFLKEQPEIDPHAYVFGFGRRRCPSQEFADAIVYLVVSRAILTFNIRFAPGTPAPKILECTSGTVSYPKPYSCVFEPRFEGAMELVSSN